MHAQMSAASTVSFGSRDSSAVIGAERASAAGHPVKGGLINHHQQHHLGMVASSLQQHHHHSNNNRIHKNGISASNFPSNHHHHLGHNYNSASRSRMAGSSPTAPSIASAAAMALNSRFSHHAHPFATGVPSNASTSNSHVQHHHHHHHHPLSLASSNSSSSASSAASSPPSASISPSSLAPGTPPQSGSILGPNPTSSYLANNNHHYQSNITQQNNQNATNYSHLSSTQSISSQQQQPQQQQQQQQQQNTSRYKTELCRPFEENGMCKYGEKCQFAHGIGELRTLTRHPKYKTEFCRTFHTTGFCPYGPRCHFIHNSKTPPTNQQTISLSSYNNGLPFGHQTSHSASPSTSPISSTSSAANGSLSLSSAASTSSSSSSSSNSQRVMDAMTGFQYGGRLTNSGLLGGPIDPPGQLVAGLDHTGVILTSSLKSPTTTASAVVNHQRRIENDETNSKGQATGCAKETQRLLWIHSQMNESSRWPPAMCASGLISNNTNSRRTWQMQA